MVANSLCCWDELDTDNVSGVFWYVRQNAKLKTYEKVTIVYMHAQVILMYDTLPNDTKKEETM